MQLHAGFTFDDAAGCAEYLGRLGVTHLYCSPCLQATAGSTHGYDVVDHGRLSEELGGEPAHRRLTQTLKSHGLGQILDIVPNHMAIDGRANRWWWDVLRNGRDSRYARFFDIDWTQHEHEVLAPVLGDHYGRVLEAGELRVEPDGDTFVARYYDNEFPIAPGEVNPQALQGDPDALDELLSRQHYRLAFWRIGDEELNYRRFFTIETLVGLRVEDEVVFAATHQLILDLVSQGVIDGLRVDHIDGLVDPAGYLRRLRDATGGIYVVVENILEHGEQLPETWPVAGTTGYDFLNSVNGLFVDAGNETAMGACYQDFTGQDIPFEEVAYAAKQQIMREELAAEVERVTDLLSGICERHRRHRDHTRRELRDALREVIAAFRVYRPYVQPGHPVSEADRAQVAGAVARAGQRRPDLDTELLEFMGQLLVLAHPAETEFALRFGQLRTWA
ncbi:MAG: malto-oligosyltrehalose synthase [Egibacteraceae bacterium]